MLSPERSMQLSLPADCLRGSKASFIIVENRSLRYRMSSSLRVERDFSKVPQQRVFQSLRLSAITRMAKHKERYVTRQKGTLKGQTASSPIQRAVDNTKMILPQTVYTPPQLELLFQSYILRYESMTPGMITSSTTSHEHFLKRLSMRSGTSKKRGEDSSVAQSLQERSVRRQCRAMAIEVTLKTYIPMEMKACLRLLKQNSLIQPTQMQEAMISYRIHSQKMVERVVKTNVQASEATSHQRSHLQACILKRFIRQKHSLKQTNTKNAATPTPKQRRVRNAFEKLLTAKTYSPIKKATETTLKTAKGTHLSSRLKGMPFQVMDHMCDRMATPTMMIALMMVRIRQPNQKGLCLFPGSQFKRKLT